MFSATFYESHWERVKEYLIKSYFEEQNESDENTNSTSENETDDSKTSSGDIPPSLPITLPRISPLPELIIESIKQDNKHDDPEENYEKLERKVKTYLNKLKRSNSNEDLDEVETVGLNNSLQDLYSNEEINIPSNEEVINKLNEANHNFRNITYPIEHYNSYCKKKVTNSDKNKTSNNDSFTNGSESSEERIDVDETGNMFNATYTVAGLNKDYHSSLRRSDNDRIPGRGTISKSNEVRESNSLNLTTLYNSSDSDTSMVINSNHYAASAKIKNNAISNELHSHRCNSIIDKDVKGKINHENNQDKIITKSQDESITFTVDRECDLEVHNDDVTKNYNNDSTNSIPNKSASESKYGCIIEVIADTFSQKTDTSKPSLVITSPNKSERQISPVFGLKFVKYASGLTRESEHYDEAADLSNDENYSNESCENESEYYDRQYERMRLETILEENETEFRSGGNRCEDELNDPERAVDSNRSVIAPDEPEIMRNTNRNTFRTTKFSFGDYNNLDTNDEHFSSPKISFTKCQQKNKNHPEITTARMCSISPVRTPESYENADFVTSTPKSGNAQIGQEVFRKRSSAEFVEKSTQCENDLDISSKRKRQVDDVNIKTSQESFANPLWDSLKSNFFVGVPKIYRVCRCKNHSCS